MYLYNLTLQKATGITHASYGNFSAPKIQEIIIARHKILELLRVDNQGRLETVISTEVFGVIRSLSTFRLTGAQRDYIIIGSDSGRITIIEYDATKNSFIKVHQETFGRSGCRRLVPGQYLATDPRGRAVMIGAVEKQKLVYILNRDSTARLTISSPLEAHKPQTLCYHMIGVDVGFDNPIFACIELDYADADEDPTGVAAQQSEKQLTFYELDLGLNHVVRKWGDTIDRSSNMLVAVPGGSDGPGGVLVCAENFIYYRKQDHVIVKAALPRRADSTTDRGLIIISSATHKVKLGDLYKVTFDYKDDIVNTMHLSYFDSIPVANAFCVLKTGFLFCASEFSNHYLYQFLDVGSEGAPAREEPPLFMPHSLTNLSVIDEHESLSPVTDMKVVDLFGEDNPQIFALCGKGPRSSLRILRHGLQVTEMAAQELPGNPNAIWSVRTSLTEEFDKYIVVSFVNATIVLAIGETVEEVTDSGLLTTTPTLSVSLLGEDALVQIHPNGIRHIRADKRVQEWKTPRGKSIVKCSTNQRQVVVALAGGDLIYFELDATGALIESEKVELGQEVACLEIAPVTAGRSRALFLAVGLYDSTVRMFSLDPNSSMAPIGLQALPAQPVSIAIIEMMTGGADSVSVQYVNIGLVNGVMWRTVLDAVNGTMSDPRQRFMGTRPVKLMKVNIRGNSAILALSSRSYLAYMYQGRYFTSPLTFDPLEYASSFSNESVPEGIVTVSGNKLRIIATEKLGEIFNQKIIPLTYTPRKSLIYPNTPYFIILESDHNVSSRESRDNAQADSKMDVEGAGPTTSDQPADISVGAPQAGMGRWASCIRLVDARTGASLQQIDLPENEAAFSMCLVNFPEKMTETFICIGTAKDMTLHPRRVSGGFLRLYRLNGSKLEAVHETPVEDLPYAISAFQGRLLVAVGKILRIYDFGKKKLLRKCENRNFPNVIQSMHVRGDRIVLGDVTDGFVLVKYRRSENQLYLFADTVIPRWLSASAMLDYDTMAGADKFGNVFVQRLPQDAVDAEDEDPTGASLKWEKGTLNGAPYKMASIAEFHVGDLVTSMAKASLVPGGQEAILYSTVLGSIAALLPFVSREDVDFFTHLEMHLRQENPPLAGRDHLAYRSSFTPVKNVIDGDLCEQYLSIDANKQRAIAAELEREPSEVAKKLEDIRNRLL